MEFIQLILDQVNSRLRGKQTIEVLNEIAKNSADIYAMSVEDQYLLGAVLGAMLHKNYCDSRHLSPEKRAELNIDNELANEPRLKVLTNELDREFVQAVLNSQIPLSKTLFLKENGQVVMDIANTEFVNLSPFWQKDNFQAGCSAIRTVITCWEGLKSDDPKIREFATVGIANAIHEAWISRGNIYFDQASDGQIYTNMNLATSYVSLPLDEKQKDLEHMVMATGLVDQLVELFKENQDSKDQDKNNGQPHQD